MRIRPAIPADIPAMIALDRHAATAAHWSTEQYETAFSGEGPSRVVLIVEEDAGEQGFITGKALGAEWEIENIVVASPARRRGLGTRLLGEFLDLANSKAPRPFSWRSANRTGRRGGSTRNGRSPRAAVASVLQGARRRCNCLPGSFLICIITGAIVRKLREFERCCDKNSH